MVKNDLIDRYIYAVTKHMKSAMKKDVAAELETIIHLDDAELLLAGVLQ